MTDRDILKKAITRLGYEFQEGEFTVSEYGTSEKAEITLDKSLGLSLQEDGTWAFVGDPYHARTQNLNRYYGKLDQLTKELATNYAVEEGISNLEEQSYYCTENMEAAENEDGLIVMTFESYGE